MVSILKEYSPETFSDKLLKGLGAAGQSLPGAFEKYHKYQKTQNKEKLARTKGLPKSMDAYLKKFRPTLLQNEEKYNALSDLTHKYAEKGHRHEDAVRLALDDLSKSSKQSSFQPQKDISRRVNGAERGAEEGKVLGGALGNLADEFKQSYGRLSTPGRVKREGSLIGEFGKFNKGLGTSTVEHAQDIAKHPGKALTEAALGLGNILAFPVDLLEEGLKRGGFIPPDADPNLIRGGLDKVQKWIQEGKSPEEIERSLKRQTAGSFIPLGQIVRGAKWLGSLSKAESPAQALGGLNPSRAAQEVKSAQDVIRGQQRDTLAKGLFEDVFGNKSPQTVEPQAGKVSKNLEGRVGVRENGSATASRMERLSPEGKIYKPGEQASIREQQLKIHPQYEAEIAQDAAERAARQAEKSPKTLVGEAGIAKRKATAEAQLPKVQDAYHKAIARVRSVEDELARGILPEHKARADALLKAAKQELEESEFALRQVLNNAKTGEARVGIPEMRDAARSKLLKVAEDVEAGQDVKLALRDYNPEMIKQAKLISKKKTVPATRSEDFFTQVHDAYGNEYKTRLGQINQEMKALQGNPSIGNLQNLNQLRREKEVIQKLIDHIDAENAIHRHKIGLRETAQRKIARERLDKFTKQGGEQKVKDLAKNALKSPEQAAEAADAAINEAAAQAPNDVMRQRILKERESVRNRMQQVASKEGSIGEIHAKANEGPKSEKDANRWSHAIVNDINQVFNSLKGSGPSFFKTRLGQDFLLGAGGEFFKELFKEYDIPVSHSAVLAAGLGRPGRGSVYRALIASVTRASINKFKKEKYKKAIEAGDDKLVLELNNKYPPKLRKEAIEEFHQASSF